MCVREREKGERERARERERVRERESPSVISIQYLLKSALAALEEPKGQKP